MLQVTSDIPYGGVLSYSEVAAEAGSPRGSRAAGNALGSNPISSPRVAAPSMDSIAHSLLRPSSVDSVSRKNGGAGHTKAADCRFGVFIVAVDSRAFHTDSTLASFGHVLESSWSLVNDENNRRVHRC